MSDNRETAMAELELLLKPIFPEYPLVYFMRNPRIRQTEDMMPSLTIMERDDEISKRTNRDYAGYPCHRDLQVVVEIWDLLTGNIKNLRTLVLQKIFATSKPLSIGTIREEKTVGPFNFGLPKVEGMQIYFKLTYKDLGPFA